MKKTITKTIAALACAILLCSSAPTTEKAFATGELKLAYQQGEAVDKLELEPEVSVDLRFLGAPDNWASLNPRWFSTNTTVAEVDDSGIVTAKAPGEACILLVLDNGMTGTTIITVKEEIVVPEASVTPMPTSAPLEEPGKEEVSEKEENKAEVKNKVVLRNQEAIHIPAKTTFSDGTPVSSINDIARYAFSFMLTDGTSIVPTYHGNSTGISDIAGVDCRKIEWASSIIVETIYLKVYIDLNDDGWVSAAEKESDEAAYYYIAVEVDKTLTVEDWSIVR